MKTSKNPIRNEASVIIGVLLIVTILATLAASALFYASNKRLTMGQTDNWQESLIVAETGVQAGISKIRAGITGTAGLTGTFASSGTFVLPVAHGGSGVLSGTANYTITKSTINGQPNQPFYKIRSLGVVRIVGGRSLSADVADVVARKLNLGTTVSNSLSGIALSGNSVRTATRMVEVWIGPIPTTNVAIATGSTLNLNNHKLTIDGFDSTDSRRSVGGISTNNPNDPYEVTGGLYTEPGTIPTEGRWTAALDPQILDASLATTGSTIGVSSAKVYGDALTNQAGVVTNSTNVMGSVRTDYDETFQIMSVPDPLKATTAGVTTATKGNSTTTKIMSSCTLRGGTEAIPGRYVVDSITLAGNSDILTFDFGQNGPTEKYVEIWVKGNLSTKGLGGASGSIIIVNGVQVKLYIGGDISLGGNGLNNTSQSSLNLSIYGVSASQSFDLGGTSTFYGSIYAPGADLTLTGGATFVGSVTSKSANLKGDVTFIHDAALDDTSPIKGFKPISWFEDTGFSRTQL